MNDVFQLLNENLDKNIVKDKIFYFEGSQVQAVAFCQGCKCESLKKIKNIIKKWGYKYNYDFDVYIFNKGERTDKYRFQRNELISSLIEWKVKRQKTSNKDEESTKFYFKKL